jgi:hypothetical protein
VRPERIPRPEPVKPIIDNEIKCSDIPPNYEVELESAHRENKRNEQGILFVGYKVAMNLNPVAKKRGPGRPKEDEVALEPKTLIGWMLEGEFLSLIRTYRKQIDQQVIHW